MTGRTAEDSLAPLVIAFLTVVVGDALYEGLRQDVTHHPATFPSFRETYLYYVVKFVLISAVSAAVIALKTTAWKSTLAIGLCGAVISGLLSSNAMRVSSDLLGYLAHFAIACSSAWLVLTVVKMT